MNNDALYRLIEEFLHLVESSTASAEKNEKSLVRLLDSLAYWVPRAKAEDPPGVDTGHRSHNVSRAELFKRFPEFGFYTDGGVELEGEFTVGDAIDDLLDITLELKEVLWLKRNVSEEESIWQLQFGFESHWEAHLRPLQWILCKLKNQRTLQGEKRPK